MPALLPLVEEEERDLYGPRSVWGSFTCHLNCCNATQSGHFRGHGLRILTISVPYKDRGINRVSHYQTGGGDLLVTALIVTIKFTDKNIRI